MTPSAEFADGIELLEDASRFINQRVAGTTVAERAGNGCAQEAARFESRLAALRHERPDRVSALVLGEFKVGKSTLINALVGREIAATDVFELTQVVCRIVPVAPGQKEYVVLTPRSDRGPGASMELATFLQRAQARDLGDFAAATAYVQSDLDLVLADTPGLGATLQHELDALDALSTADIALCVVDAQGLGGGRDAATLARMNEIGLPYVCVLAKADSIAADEAEIACDYLSESLGVPRERIFPTSAARALSGGADGGVERLRRHLTDAVSPQARSLRERALLAQARDVASGYRLCIAEVLHSLDETARHVDEHLASLQLMAETVTNSLCTEAAAVLRDRLELDVERFWREAPENSIAPEEFDAALRRCFGTGLDQSFLEQLQRDLERRDQEEWFEGIQAHIHFLEENLGAMQTEANITANAELALLLRQARYKEEAMRDALGAFLSGAAVSTGMVAMGIALFPAALFAVPFGVSAFRNFKKAEEIALSPVEIREQLRTQVEAWREGGLQSVMDELRPRLLDTNMEIARRAADRFAAQLEEWPLSLDELCELRQTAHDFYDRLGCLSRQALVPAAAARHDLSPVTAARF